MAKKILKLMGFNINMHTFYPRGWVICTGIQLTLVIDAFSSNKAAMGCSSHSKHASSDVYIFNPLIGSYSERERQGTK